MHRILIIDDNRAIHDDFRKLLAGQNETTATHSLARAAFFNEPEQARQQAQFEIESAFQGEQGVDMAREAIELQRPFAIAFVDMRMPPGIDGAETATRLLALDPELQVVICTAHFDYSWPEMATQFGDSDRLLILKKPFEAVEVLQLAHTLTHKWVLSHALHRRLCDLELLVAARTQELAVSNQQLRAEVAERSRAESQIREQAALLDKAQDAILVRDLGGGILYWNASAEQLYGWSASQALGRKVTDLIYTERDAFDEAQGILIERGEWIGEIVQVNASGQTLIIEAHWTLVRDDLGQPKSILAINTDLTERKKLEGQLLRAQRMESIGLLAGGIAHDLNNVLCPIMMALDILQSRFPDDDSRSILEVLDKSAQRGAAMINQLLQFARGAEGDRTLVEPAYIVRDVGKVAAETFPKNIEVKIRIAPELWFVSADATQIHQVLLNLCVNARDAMPLGGVLSVTASNATLDATFASMSPGAKAGRYVSIEVSDTGTGISPIVLDKIFEPFFTTKEFGKGTGLGLSTSLGIVKSHGGFLDVQSETGMGSIFRVYLPASRENLVKPLEPSRDLPCGAGETILVIDDDETVRTITADSLQQYHYRVLTASDGAEACALYARQASEITVVLTDLVMPIMDGPATIRTLKRMNPNLPIIAATGFSGTKETALAGDAGVRAFISKPYRIETLLQILREILDENAPRERPDNLI